MIRVNVDLDGLRLDVDFEINGLAHSRGEFVNKVPKPVHKNDSLGFRGLAARHLKYVFNDTVQAYTVILDYLAKSKVVV